MAFEVAVIVGRQERVASRLCTISVAPYLCDGGKAALCRRMHKGRLEAFSDGVFAIIITIMVLEMKVPHGTGFAALAPVIPVFLSYTLSYLYVGIYWNNHHHLFQAVKQVSGPVL